MENTTLCYLEQSGCYLMMHRTKKEKDINKGKWIGVGGKFEEGESPHDCVVREVREETGFHLKSYHFRGIVTFLYGQNQTQHMHLFTATDFTGQLKTDCPEGTLQWIKKDDILKLPLWEGDKIFLNLLKTDRDFFTLKLSYQGDTLIEAVLDGKLLSLDTI